MKSLHCSFSFSASRSPRFTDELLINDCETPIFLKTCDLYGSSNHTWIVRIYVSHFLKPQYYEMPAEIKDPNCAQPAAVLREYDKLAMQLALQVA